MVDSSDPRGPQIASEALRPLPRDHPYDLALSFAGEDREVARRIAHVARSNGLSVFFDEHHLWEAWGKDLSEYLGSVYGEGARYCVILISEDYCRKPYTILERRMALARSLESKEEYVLPVVLDDSWPPGLPRTTAYLDLRTMQPTDVAEAIVRKVKGQNWEMRHTEDPPWPRLEMLEKDTPAFQEPTKGTRRTLLDFADVTIARECHAWKEGDPYVEDSWPSGPSRWSFRGGFGYYEDPIFDITILNRSDAPRLISRIGIEALGTSHRAYGGLGGGGAEPVHLHRTYQIPVPDLWRTLADGHLAASRNSADQTAWDRWPLQWVDAEERSSCRLPDPVLVDPGRAYRFGLHLLDYTSLCPTEVELVFWAQTDRGEARSERARLSYFIGSDIQPLRRYRRILEGPPEVERQSADALASMFGGFREQEKREHVEQLAYSLWERAGRPPGQDQEFWTAAERQLGRDLIVASTLQEVHKRPF